MNGERFVGYGLIWAGIVVAGLALAVVLGADTDWFERVWILAPTVTMTWAAAKGLSVDGRIYK